MTHGKYLAFSFLALLPTSWAAANHKRHFNVHDLYRQVAPAEFHTHSVRGSHVRYADNYAGITFNQSLTPCNTLSYKLGHTFMKFDWEANPRFRDKYFKVAGLSLEWTSYSVEKWRWILEGGVTVDTKAFNFGKTGVYSGMMWGRYAYTPCFGIHLGWFGFVGMRTGYMLPILGIDWQWKEHIKLNAIFPLNVSLVYSFNKHWSSSLALTSFGGPYRYPWRAHHGIGNFHDAIFQVHATGVYLSLDYKRGAAFAAGIGGGDNFGGWIYIRNHHGTHGKYFKYNSAPYGEAHMRFSF